MYVQACLQNVLYTSVVNEGGVTSAIVLIVTFGWLNREGNNLEIQVDIETKPSHLCLTSEEDLTPQPGSAAPGPISGGEEPQDCSSRRGGALCGSELGLSPGMSLREGLRDVTLAQPESIRSDLEMSDTQSDDIAELTSDDCDSPHPKSCHLMTSQQHHRPSCRDLNPEGLHCPTDSNVILYIWKLSRWRENKSDTRVWSLILNLNFFPISFFCRDFIVNADSVCLLVGFFTECSVRVLPLSFMDGPFIYPWCKLLLWLLKWKRSNLSTEKMQCWIVKRSEIYQAQHEK